MSDHDYDHPFDLDEMNRDPTDEELTQLTDHQLAELYRDVAAGAGSIDCYDSITAEMVDRFDTYEAENDWPGTGTAFNNTELALIALVLNQNAEDYGPEEEDIRHIRQIATKARQQIDHD